MTTQPRDYVWQAVIDDEPEFNPQYPTDPVDWKVRFVRLRDDDLEDEVIFVIFTGFENEQTSQVRPWPIDRVEARIEAMIAGLNAEEKPE